MADGAVAQALVLEAPRSPARRGPSWSLAPEVSAVTLPGVWPDLIVFKELRVLGALGVDVTAYRAALDLLVSGRYPFASLPRRCVGLDDVEELLATMAGERDDVPPVHGVLTP